MESVKMEPEAVQIPPQKLQMGVGRSPYRFKGHPTSSHMIILKIAGEGKNRRLLDVGSANGFLARRLTERGWQVAAIEQDPDLASLARRYCHHVVVADLNEKIPSFKESFDAIIYGDVLEHLVRPEYVFNSLNQYLTKDGMVIISIPNIAHLWVRMSLFLGRFDYADRGILDRTHLRFYTLKTLREFLDRCRMQVVEMFPIPAPLWVAVPRRFYGKWLYGLHSLNTMGARFWPGGLAYQFVMKGIRK